MRQKQSLSGILSHQERPPSQVSPSGTRTITGDAISQDNIASEGAFGVTGAPMSDFIVTFGSAHCKSGTSSIVVDGFKTNLSLNAGTTDSNGKAVFYVGATARITIQNKKRVI